MRATNEAKLCAEIESEDVFQQWPRVPLRLVGALIAEEEDEREWRGLLVQSRCFAST